MSACAVEAEAAVSRTPPKLPGMEDLRGSPRSPLYGLMILVALPVAAGRPCLLRTFFGRRISTMCTDSAPPERWISSLALRPSELGRVAVVASWPFRLYLGSPLLAQKWLRPQAALDVSNSI